MKSLLRSAPAVTLALSLLALLSLGRLFWRIRFGVDFTDEAWYATLGYRFFSGDRPFIDEMNPAQSMGFFIAPVVWLYAKWHPDLQGLFYGLRLAYVAFVSAVALLSFYLLKGRMSRVPSVFALCLYLSFTPFGIPALSYYTLAAGFMMLSLFSSGSSKRAFLSGACLSMAVLAYPPLVVVLVFQWVRAIQRRVPGWKVYSGAILLTLIGFAVLYRVTPASLFSFVSELRSQKIPHAAQHTQWSHLAIVFQKAVSYLGRSFTWLSVLSLALVLRKRTSPPFTLVILTVLIPFTLWGHWSARGGYGPEGVIIAFAFMMPFLAKGSEESNELLWPALLGGLLMMVVSQNGLQSAASSLLPLCVLAIGHWWRRMVGHQFLAVFLLIGLLFGFWHFECRVYSEGKTNDLTVKIERGIYAGLYTQKAKHEFIEPLEDDLMSLNSSSKYIFVQPHFPPAYLMNRRKPMAFSTFETCVWTDVDVCIARLRHRYGDDSLILLLYRTPTQPKVFDRPPVTNSKLIGRQKLKMPPLKDTSDYGIYAGWRGEE